MQRKRARRERLVPHAREDRDNDSETYGWKRGGYVWVSNKEDSAGMSDTHKYKLNTVYLNAVDHEVAYLEEKERKMMGKALQCGKRKPHVMRLDELCMIRLASVRYPLVHRRLISTDLYERWAEWMQKMACSDCGRVRYWEIMGYITAPCGGRCKDSKCTVQGGGGPGKRKSRYIGNMDRCFCVPYELVYGLDAQYSYRSEWGYDYMFAANLHRDSRVNIDIRGRPINYRLHCSHEDLERINELRGDGWFIDCSIPYPHGSCLAHEDIGDLKQWIMGARNPNDVVFIEGFHDYRRPCLGLLTGLDGIFWAPYKGDKKSGGQVFLEQRGGSRWGLSPNSLYGWGFPLARFGQVAIIVAVAARDAIYPAPCLQIDRSKDEWEYQHHPLYAIYRKFFDVDGGGKPETLAEMVHYNYIPDPMTIMNLKAQELLLPLATKKEEEEEGDDLFLLPKDEDEEEEEEKE